jgi:hypothetical protein
MKIASLCLLGLAVTRIHAADPVLPEFNSKTIGHPPLLLGDSTGNPTAPFQFGSLLTPRPTLAKAMPAPPKVARGSGMPILEPNPAIDFKMMVKAPDPTIDFKMIVKSPANEPAK